jgi:DNA-binding NarL/FixJ family response regulator
MKILLVCDDESNSSDIEQLIKRDESLTLVETISGSRSRKSIENSPPQLVWIALDPRPMHGLSLLAELKEAFPHIHFWVSCREVDPQLMRTAYRLKASDFLDPKSWNDDLPLSVKRIEMQRSSDSDSKDSVASQKSGPLSTLLICDADMKKRATIEDLMHFLYLRT